MGQKVVVVLDPGVGSQNIGDEIISSAVMGVIRECSDEQTRVVRFSVHQALSRKQLTAIEAADVVIAGGSNLLNFRYIPSRQPRWNNTLQSMLRLRDVWLLGVGWQSYHDNSNWLGRHLYKAILAGDVFHSVRDDFSRRMLEKHGVSNVINTACPTMWSLGKELLDRIPVGKADSVIFTLTDYAPDRARDEALIRAVCGAYRNVYFWPQGFSDLTYLQSFSAERITILRPTLEAFDEVLAEQEVDYVGTRLHAGIRALQYGRRALILPVDNRAAEISRDCGIALLGGRTHEEFTAHIESELSFAISLPGDKIEIWKEQLRRRLA